MGAWGVGLFSDDLALDIKTDYFESLNFYDDFTCKALMIEKYKEFLNYPDQASIFWYALSICMWQLGRLDDETKEKALFYINNPKEDGNLLLWKDNYKQYQKRLEVLNKIKEKLISPQKPYKKIKLWYSVDPKFKVGDVVYYKLTNKEFTKFIKSMTYHEKLSNPDLSLLNTLYFNNKYVYMVKLFNQEYSYVNGMSLKEAREKNLVGNKEYFAVFNLFSNEKLSMRNLEEISIEYICDDETRYIGLFDLKEFMFEKKHYFNDPLFLDVNKFIFVENNQKLFNHIISKYNLDEKKVFNFENGMVCCSLIRSKIIKE